MRVSLWLGLGASWLVATSRSDVNTAGTTSVAASSGCVDSRGWANASCFGYDAVDATAYLQAALDSTATTILIDPPPDGGASTHTHTRTHTHTHTHTSGQVMCGWMCAPRDVRNPICTTCLCVLCVQSFTHCSRTIISMNDT